MDNPSFYKQFRHQVSTLNSTFKKRDTVVDKNSEYFNRLRPLLEFLACENPSEYMNNFDEILSSFLAINGKTLENQKMGKRIELAYMLLDFHPYFMDKVNKKNKPSNINRDCKNLFFASQAKYYVTEDKSTYQKAKYVTDALALKVKVTTMSDFMARFC